MLNLDGNVEMEASIMEGANLKGGCVTLVQNTRHPITLARTVLERSNHTFLGAEGAMRFAREFKVDILEPNESMVTEYAREALAAFKKDMSLGRDTSNARTEIGHLDGESLSEIGEVGTVGAVAIDKDGNIAVATSTGGMTGKVVGRIGDTPVLGSGTYADNLYGGVSTTGHGESIMRFNVAQRILARIELLGEDASTATQIVLQRMTEKLGKGAGAITIDADRRVGIYFTSSKMSWAYQRGSEVHYGIRPGDDFVESI